MTVGFTLQGARCVGLSSLFEGSELSLFWVLNYLAFSALGYLVFVGSESKIIPYGSIS